MGLLTDNGVNVLFDATANKRSWRDARKRINRFLEVYLECPLEGCRSRDPKGIYEMVNVGKARYVPGAQEEYEPPEHPDLVLDCRGGPEELTDLIITELRNHGFI